MQFLNYQNRIVKEFRKNLFEAQSTLSVKSIHDLRLMMKRLRSLLEVLSDIDVWFQDEEFESRFKGLFKAAGRVRDLHVAEELVWKWAVETSSEVSEYYNYLKEREKNARQSFLAVSKNFKINSITELSSAIAERIGKISEEEFERVVGWSAVGALMRIASKKTESSLPDEKLHVLRMAAKDARYRIQVLAVIRNEKEEYSEIDNWLRDLHLSIGLWHDMIIACTNLEVFLTEDAVRPVYSSESYDALIKELWKRSNDALNRFYTVWDDKGKTLPRTIEQLQIYNI